MEPELPGRQGAPLLAYLVLHRDRSVDREELIEALWGSSPPPTAESSLNALISKVRKAARGSVEGRSELRFVADDCWVDLEAADEAIHRAESFAALERWDSAWSPARVALHVAGRGFMRGHSAAWIEPWRRRTEDIHVRALECYAQACLGIGGAEIPGADRSLRKLVEISPFRESAHRLLMEAHAATGNVAEALRVYERLRSLLRSELGVGPSETSRKLHSELLASCEPSNEVQT